MKKIVLFVCTAVLTGLTTAFIVKYSSGIAGRTGGPGETTCSACHSGGSGATTVNISATPAFTGNQYIPGNTYTITIDVSNSAYNLFGFGCEILDGATNTDAGNMTVALSGVKFLTATNGRKNATHTSPKSGTGTANFQFVWTAPVTTNSAVVIYAAGNAVNGNGGTSGDMVGATSLIITPNTTGINNAEIKNTISVFPNPASNFVNINIQYFHQPQNASIGLFDIKGNKVSDLMTTKINYGNNNYHIFIPDNISNGIYIIKAKTSDGYTLSKILLIQK